MGSVVATMKTAAETAASEAKTATAEAEGPKQSRASNDEVVLIVEDEAIVRMLVVDVLSEFGYRVLEAADGPTALRILQSEPRIDLLVTDIGLPGLNGRQLADAARVNRPGLKVLFMTGYAETAASSSFLQPGMAIITKPFVMDTLASRIREMLEAQSVPARAPR
jgi:CheY-like chemotaxis protein